MSSPGGKGQNTLPPGTSLLGLKAFLASLSLLFISTLCVYWIVRGQAEFWSAGLPGIPNGLWVSSGILAFLSLTSELAARALGAGKQTQFRRLFGISFILALAFVCSQLLTWRDLSNAHLSPKAKSLYAFSLYMLTGLHALHVAGGLVWQGMALRKFVKGEGGFETARNTATYWHFLSLCWILLFGSLILGSNPNLTGDQILRSCWYLCGFGIVMFIACWIKAIIAIAKHEGGTFAALAIIPMVAYLRAFMAADEMRMRRTLLWWAVWFGFILATLCIGISIRFAPENQTGNLF